MPAKRKPPSFSKWKTAAKVERLRILKRRIGSGGFGTVWLGRIKFKGEPSKQVAVKEFVYPLTDARARAYQKVIDDLVATGVPLPKMGLVKHEGKWVLVSQSFVKGGKTKFLIFPSSRTKADTIFRARVCARIINAGYADPSFDLFEVMRPADRRKGLASVPIDIDVAVPDLGVPLGRRVGKGEIRKNIRHALRSLFIVPMGLREKVLRAFIAELKPEYRPVARQLAAELFH